MREGILKEGRLGKFGLPYNLIVGEQAWVLNKLTQHIIIIEAKDIFYERQVIYTGRSHLFAWIPGGKEIPWYKIEFNNRDHSIKSVVEQGYAEEKPQGTIPAFSREEIEILKGLIEKGNVS